jgi:AraC-like DNA-binding protein
MARVVAPGFEISRERTARRVARHHHLTPYAAVVLRGGYVEAGDRGRFRAEAGVVLFHDGFEAHQDQFHPGGADILNLPMAAGPARAAGRLADPDALIRIAERDPAAAAMMLLAWVEPGGPELSDWPDRLAADLRADRVASLSEWARFAGLQPSSVSRGFRLCYGVSPQRYRLEQRTAKAARRARGAGTALALVAAEVGFADQSHMCRAMRRVFEATPAALRRGHVKSVQDARGPVA